MPFRTLSNSMFQYIVHMPSNILIGLCGLLKLSILYEKLNAYPMVGDHLIEVENTIVDYQSK